MRPLKILYTEAATGYGGQERYIHRLMRQMRNQGHEVHALVQPDSQLLEHLRTDQFMVHTRVMDTGSDFWRNLLPIRRLLLNEGFDVVNTHSRRDTVHVGCAARLANVPLIIRTRHLARPIGSLLSYSWIPHRVIAVSEFVRNQIVQRGMAADDVAVVFPAVELPNPLPEQYLRTELGLNEDAIIVGSIAVLRKEKGMQELIQAMAPLLRNQAQLHLVIIGGGVLQNTLENFSEQLEVRSQVHFLGNRNDIAHLIGDFDIFASATYLEASGTTFAEAAAAAKPVVGTEVGGVPEMMRPGKSGLLVPLHDIVSLRNAINKLVQNPELRQQMGQAGYQYAVIEGAFSLATFQAKTEQSYRRWLEQKHHV